MSKPRMTTKAIMTWLSVGGSIDECAEHFGVDPEVIRWHMTRAQEIDKRSVWRRPQALPVNMTVDEIELALLDQQAAALATTLARARECMHVSVDNGAHNEAKTWAITIGILHDKIDMALKRVRSLRPVEEKHVRADFDSFPEPEPPEHDKPDTTH